jgi:hypothetical protein
VNIKNMTHEFGQQHPGLCIVIIAIMLMLNGWIDYGAGLKPVAYVSWFFGGILGIVALSCCIGGYILFFGLFRWPIAAIVFITGMYALWRFRPKNPNLH